LPLVSYGCDFWSLTLIEEHRVVVFENRALKGIFGQERDAVGGRWRKLPNEELLKPMLFALYNQKKKGSGP
jgi:hypothetical protein